MPSSAVSPHRWLALTVVAYVALAVAAAVDGGRLLLHVDRPVTREAVEHRTAWLDDVMLALTHVGSGAVMVALGVVLAVVVAPHHRLLAITVVVLPIVRPLIVTGLKEIVGRERPSLAPLSDAAGASFPSGHVVASTMWFLVPIVLTVVRPGPLAIRTATMGAAVAVVVVASTRVYLGVHWVTDVVGGALVGGLMIAGVWSVRQRPIGAPVDR